eukprot:5564807-Pleurochrysis_carterae.AAC.1
MAAAAAALPSPRAAVPEARSLRSLTAYLKRFDVSFMTCYFKYRHLLMDSKECYDPMKAAHEGHASQDSRARHQGRAPVSATNEAFITSSLGKTSLKGIIAAIEALTAATQGAEFVRRFAPTQFEAALHTIQDKYASLYYHLSGIDPEASPTHPHSGAAPAGTRSQATSTPAEDKYIESEDAPTIYATRKRSALYEGMPPTLRSFKRSTPPPLARAELRGLSFKATVNLRAPA